MTYHMEEVVRCLGEDPQAAIAQWEGEYTRQIAAVAADIAAHRDQSPVVLLAGPSASSKTTTAGRIRGQLMEMGVCAHLISMDNYYRPWDDADFPQNLDGTPDLESPLCLDIPLLNEHFRLLETGGDIYVPIYDFPTHSRLPGRGLRMDASQKDVFLFEGIHALSTLFTEKHPAAYRVYVSPEDDFSLDGVGICSPELLRLMRRVVRDFQFRGASARYSLGLWHHVIEGEKQYIAPFRKDAHRQISTTLPYELMVLRGYVRPLLGELGPDAPCWDQVERVLHMMERIQDLPGALVPKASILREFIGGGE